MTYREIVALCDKLDKSGNLHCMVCRAVDQECAEWAANFRRQIPRRPYTKKAETADFENAKSDVAEWIEADMNGKKSDDGVKLGKILTPDDVLRCRRGRLTAWAVAQKLRKASR